MIDTKEFFDYLTDNGIDFFTGVPDSLLKEFCSCVYDNCDSRYNIIAANEGNAVGLAAGYHLATGKFGVVYMQNSGTGNAVNPLVSLADEKVYSIPMLIICGWRGEPGVKDEPQHVKQGEITSALFDTIGLENFIIEDDYRSSVDKCLDIMKNKNRPAVLIVKKNTFSRYSCSFGKSGYSLSRERAVEIITGNISPDDVVVSTTGKTSRELFEIRNMRGESHSSDFLTVGSMGHTSSIALGMSLFTDRNVYCIDGDGSFLMHMGAAAVNAANAGDNFRYIIINNGSHDSVGGQPTVGFEADFEGILRSCGFRNTVTVSDENELINGMEFLKSHPKSAMVVFSEKGSRDNLGRPDISPVENKKMIMEKLIK